MFSLERNGGIRPVMAWTTEKGALGEKESTGSPQEPLASEDMVAEGKLYGDAAGAMCRK